MSVREQSRRRAQSEAAKERILRYPDLKQKSIPFSRQYVHKLVSTRRFPRPVYLGRFTMGWLESEIDAWIAARVADRDLIDA